MLAKLLKVLLKMNIAHLNFGEVWLKEHFAESKAELELANRQNLPIVWKMLNEVEGDADKWQWIKMLW